MLNAQSIKRYHRGLGPKDDPEIWFIAFKDDTLDDGLLLFEWLCDYTKQLGGTTKSRTVSYSVNDSGKYYSFDIIEHMSIHVVLWSENGNVNIVDFQVCPGDKHYLLERIPALQELLFQYLI